MNAAVLICTYGDPAWEEKALTHALPSVADRGVSVRRLHDPDGTLASVRNRAARDSVGADWLCFLDADDRLDPGYLPAMAEAASSCNLMLPTLLVPAVRYDRLSGSARAEAPGWGRPVCHVNAAVIGTLVPRRLFQEVGGFEEYLLYEDWDLWLRCLKAGARIRRVPDAVYIADAAPGRNQPDRALRETVYWTIRRAHKPELEGRYWRDG